uniref:G_PROTEIN_RECEP_F1_2 domain-containing protein n=1 Tax=Caenorhabditis tropicalis TaxID=1561998 RepID=A0A1I7TY39_9PELO
MSRQCSGFLVLYIAAVRAFSIIFPLSNFGERLMKPKSGFIVVFSSVIVFSIWSFAYFLQASFKAVPYCYEERASYVPYALVRNDKFEATYLFIDGSISLFICLLYVILAVALVIAIFKISKRKRAFGNDKGSNPSLMIIFMAGTVFLSQFSYAALYLFNYFFLQGYEDQKVFIDLDSLALTLFLVNSAVHAFICFLMSSQYRDTVVGMICVKKIRKEITKPVDNTINSISDSLKT